MTPSLKKFRKRPGSLYASEINRPAADVVETLLATTASQDTAHRLARCWHGSPEHVEVVKGAGVYKVVLRKQLSGDEAQGG